MCSSPQIQATQRSIPIPKPPCGTGPYLRRSMYHSKASLQEAAGRFIILRQDGRGAGVAAQQSRQGAAAQLHAV
jgi:GTP cyclohydrolase II